MICSYAELVIESQNPILMHGLVADAMSNIAKIIAPLEHAGVGYSVECYDEHGALLCELGSRIG
jgi:hypothetical protein